MNLGGLTDRARMAAGQRFSHSIRTRLALDEVGNWALDRADGTITHDFSGWDNHGTIHLGTGDNTNLAAAFVPGVHGQAMSFDGVDDRVSIPNAINLNPNNITIELWYFPRNVFITTIQGQIRKELSYIIQHGIEVGRLRPHIHSGGTWHIMEANNYLTANNTWYHVVVTYNGVAGIMN